LRINGPIAKALGEHVAINSILTAGLSSINANSAAMRVTANNIANVNTPGYVRRTVQHETLAPAGLLSGVTLGEVNRAVDAYFGREVVNSRAAFARYDTQSTFMDQLNAVLGAPGDGSSLSSRLDSLYAALGQASLDPALLANRQSALAQFQNVAQSVSDLSFSINALRQSADRQLGVVTDTANDLIKRLWDINNEIEHALMGGDTATGLLDQRDQMVNELSKLIGIRTNLQSDGRLFIATENGLSLVSDVYTRMKMTPSSGPSFHPLTIQSVNTGTGQVIGTPQVVDPHSGSGEIRGLLDMRDIHLAQLGEELGSFAQGLTLAVNAQHNANGSVPPPAVMNGRQTGLLAGDGLNFDGQVTIGLAGANGTLQHRIPVDFDAGTLSLDGGPAVAFGGTIGGFATALDTALGGLGDATFTDGQLRLSANGGAGFVITGDTNNPAKRAGVGFSHFFGMNDLFQSDGQSIQTTGLTAADAGGFAPGGVISLLLRGPKGERVNEADVAVAGATIGDMVTALNTAFTGRASFTLDANGKLSMTPAAGFEGYTLDVTADTTARGTTGESFTSLFGLGSREASFRAFGFSLSPDMTGSPQRLAFAQSTLTSTTTLGEQIVGAGDNRGLLALQNLSNTTLPFGAGGSLPARTMTLSDYIATFYQDISARGATIDANRMSQETRLAQAEKNLSQREGVNLDEELANMMTLQHAYNAGARLIRVADEMYEALLNVI
jgi:flagellar hook-associated protein 1 FlgK